MKRIYSVISVILIVLLFGLTLVGCRRDNKDNQNDQGNDEENNQDYDQSNDKANDQDEDSYFREYSAFFAVPGNELPMNNRVMNAIAEVTGGKVNMTWLTEQTVSERIGVMVAGGEYPDFIDGSAGTAMLIEAGALIPIDEYWDDYPNIKNYLSKNQWNKIRKEDGHIYIIPQFGIIQGKETATNHEDEAFWIQKAVLEWADYPKLKSIDEFFDIVYRYVDENPEIEGQSTLGFTVYSNDWRYFGLENPPMFLAGYPNDGVCIVDPETITAYNYNTIDEAYHYFKKLNQVYNDGYFDASAFTDSYDQYISKISSGRVVGMVDQHWNFQTAEETLKSAGLVERTYVPQPITLDADTIDRWYSPSVLDASNGIGISTSCENPEEALQFINDLLSPEVMILRYWGEEGIDYFVGEDEVFYRTEKQRKQREDTKWVGENLCSYDYFPHYEGMLADGINTVKPSEQPGEFRKTLTETDRKLLDAYGFINFLDFLNTDVENSDWFPMWSFTNTWTGETDYGIAKIKMDEIKHEWLPKVIMASTADFDSTWEQYQNLLTTEVDLEVYEATLTEEARRRVAVAQGVDRVE
ncbi:extracellular solute-binding protein [Mobilitalea sibirica]|uniref:Extracellular solute-binding protein n=1 Tax=Mobilitalea sibirica TaxID=1462919 RepID=A0A8J7KU93_9FIRM|nr:extracellular solute-binding protein [Mobilitalea sibirica]MBH1942231.1 extracellular solute-binding protein [Mobilitalea sibirica]